MRGRKARYWSKEAGNFSGELEAPQFGARLFEVASRVRKLAPIRQLREQLHDAPGKIFARIETGIRPAGQGGVHQAGDEFLRKQE